jgi:hypothetical protein
MFLLKSIGAVLLSAAVGFGGAMLVDLGYDWGYIYANMVLHGQAFNQGNLALMTLPYLLFPLFGFWSLGYLTRNEKRALLPFLVGILGSALMYWYVPVEGTPVANVVWPSVALITASASFICSRRLFRFLQSRMNASVIYMPAAVALLCTAVCTLPVKLFDFELPKGPGLEMGLYSLLLAAVACFAARGAHPRGTIGGAFAGVLAVLPIMVANAINVGGNLLSLGLDQLHFGADLGPSALLSATFIAVSAIVACVAGGAAGAILASRQSSSARTW